MAPKLVQTIATAKQLPDLTARAWAVAQRLEIFGYSEIAAELSITHKVASTIVRGWLEEGRIRQRGGGAGNARLMFRIADHHQEPKDRSSMVSQQLWNAACGLKTFTPVDLQAHCRADLRIEPREASSYCQALLRAGYLAVKVTAIPGQREATYRLIRNSGPRAPREKRVQTVWDPNEAGYVYIAGLGRIGGAL